MQPITLTNGWKSATISQWVSSCGSCFIVVDQHGRRREFKTLAGARKHAEFVTR